MRLRPPGDFPDLKELWSSESSQPTALTVEESMRELEKTLKPRRVITGTCGCTT
jgi:hypothetical protein